MTDHSRSDLLPLAERIRAVHVLRALMLLIGVVVALVPQVGTQSTIVVLAGAASYVVLSLVLEAGRLLRGRGLALLGVGLLLDGAFLSAGTACTGGFRSPLTALVMVYVLAVTLVTSYRTGLKLALWVTLLQYSDFVLGISAPPDAAGRLRDLVVLVFTVTAVSLGTATFSAVNERELRRRTSELEAIRTLSFALDDATTSEEVAQRLADVSFDAIGAERVIVIGTRDGWTRVMAWAGTDAPDVPPGAGLGTNDILLGQAWSTRRAVLAADLQPGDSPLLAAALPGASNIVVVPMQVEGNPIGALVLELGVTAGGRMERRVLTVAEQFASHAGLALSSAWLLEEVGRLAVTDSLTGLANRRALEREAGRFTARATRRHEPLSLVLLDIDHFKALNDTFGHQTGDEVLREVALTLQRAARGEDIVARYGGEEFAVLMPACDEDEAAIVAERLRAAVADGSWSPTVTISGGVATYVPNDDGLGLDLHDLLRGADLALYVSKRGGRNRISLARDLTPELMETLPQPARGRRVRAT